MFSLTRGDASLTRARLVSSGASPQVSISIDSIFKEGKGEGFRPTFRLSLAAVCEGINPYTLTAKLGPAQIGGFGPPKDDVWPGQPDRSPAQGVKADLAIKQDPG